MENKAGVTGWYIGRCCTDYRNLRYGGCVDYAGDEVQHVVCKVCGMDWWQDLLVHMKWSVPGHETDRWEDEGGR